MIIALLILIFMALIAPEFTTGLVALAIVIAFCLLAAGAVLAILGVTAAVVFG